MAREKKIGQEGDTQRTTVSFTGKFWKDTEAQMEEEGFNNFSSYVTHLIKMRREELIKRGTLAASDDSDDSSSKQRRKVS